MPDPSSLYAVLIDADNVSSSHAEAILKEITQFGEPALRRVYGDWSTGHLAGWKKTAAELGLVQRQLPSNTSGKNATDIGLVIDAMDILHSGRFDGFVLVSSDSDFTALASRIREQGLAVIGIGEAKTPVSLRNTCNRFVLIENIAEEDAPQTGKRKPTEAVPLIRRAMDAVDQESDWVGLGAIGQKLVADNPDFDPRTYGKKKLSDLVGSLKLFELRRGSGNHMEVRRKD